MENCRNNMVEELDMEQTNNTNLALICEMVEWFNTTYCYIFVNELRKLLAQNNKVWSEISLITRPLFVNLIPPSGYVR